MSEYPQPVVDAFAAVKFQMEQLPGEIWPFAEWLWNRHPHNVLEIGVRHGGTSALWHGLCTGQVIGIDWNGADSLRDTQESRGKELELAYDRYRFVLGDSHLALTQYKVLHYLNHNDCADYDRVDFIFIDGDHSYKGVRQDFYEYRHLLAAGGCIAFHDIVDTPTTRNAGQGVFRFWNELKDRYPDNWKEFCVNGEWGGIGAIVLP